MHLTTGTPGQSWKNIFPRSSQTSADCWANSVRHVGLMRKHKKAHPRYTNIKPPLLVRQTRTQYVQGAGERAFCSQSRWGLERNTEVRGLQTFPLLLPPNGVRHYLHFTNKVRAVAPDAGSGGSSGEDRHAKQKQSEA